jgi:multifunctional methyltransferase subunit TRM112
MCNRASCRNLSIPLTLNASEVTHTESEFNPDLTSRILTKLSWPDLVVTAQSFGVQLPTELGEPDLPALEQLHRLLFNVRHRQTQVKEGAMVCQNCGHAYTIQRGIANMLAEES